MAVTLKDIADSLGISVTTVSFALRGKKPGDRSLSEETVRQVRQKAAQMGYRPNMAAAGLRSSKTGIAGILVSRMQARTGEFLSRIRENLADGLSPFLCCYDGDGAIEKRQLEILINQRADGIIATYSGSEENIPLYRQAAVDFQIPLVLIDRSIPSLDIPVVMADYRRAAFRAAGELLSMGHERIDFICMRVAKSLLESSSLREKGYREAMGEAGFNANVNIIASKGAGAWQPERLKAFTSNVLDDWQSGRSNATAMLIEHDILAYEIMNDCHKRGIDIPSNLSIMSMNKQPASALEQVALSTIEYENPGKEAAQMLNKLMRKQKPRQREVLTGFEIKLRKTIAPVR